MGNFPNRIGTKGHVHLIKSNDSSWVEKVNDNFKYLHTYRTHIYSDTDKTENVDSNLPTGANYDRIIFLDTETGVDSSVPSGTCTITLPSATANLGREVIFIRVDNGQFIDVTETGAGSLIGVTQLPKSDGLRAVYVSDGSNWYGRVVDN